MFGRERAEAWQPAETDLPSRSFHVRGNWWAVHGRAMQNQPVRVTLSRPSAMLGSRPRTIPSHPRCVMRGVRCRELGAARVSARTALESLVCDPLRSVIEIGAPHEEQIVPPFALHFCPNERAPTGQGQ